jgi:hypothetical protein
MTEQERMRTEASGKLPIHAELDVWLMSRCIRETDRRKTDHSFASLKSHTSRLGVFASPWFTFVCVVCTHLYVTQE